MRRKAFTLVELLTVVAISSVLLLLIVIPLFQGFNFTRQAQAYAEAQERARQLAARFTREIGNAVAVRENSGIKGAITVVLPNSTGLQVPVTLPYAKLDLWQPSEGDPTRGPSGAYINPQTGMEDPTIVSPKGDVSLPVTPGLTFLRYFIGLRNPIAADGSPARYTNPFDGLLMARGSDRDNLFVIWRAEVQPYVYVNGERRVNTALFLDADNDNVPDDIDDPAFFTLLPDIDYNPVNGTYTPAGQLKSDRIRRWMSQGTYDDPTTTPEVERFPNGNATLLTEVSRFDAVQPVFDKRTRLVVYDNVEDLIEPGVNRERPRVMPLIQFRPTRVASDPAEGQVTARLGVETENASEIAPDVFTTKMGGWANALVKVLPWNYNRLDEAFDTSIVGRTDPDNGLAGEPQGFSLFFFDPDGMNEETLDGIEFFDVYAYENAITTSSTPYSFSAAIASADARSAWLSDPALYDEFLAFFPDSATGKIIGSFGISEVGDSSLTPPPSNPNNLPAAGTGFALSPQQDTGAGQPYSPLAGVYQINLAFNRIWNENPDLRPNLHRFIDLRATPQGDGTLSPLDPLDGFGRARLVAGSEEVFGPDQNAGPNYGRPIRYTRVTRTPGPNQYRINYVDLTEPDYLLAGYASVPPAAYDPNDFMSAVIQPRYKAGYIELNSDPNLPLPEGEFQVYYRFQFTRPNDTFMVSYDTRQVININLTILTYPQSSNTSSQTVTLQTSATAKNFIR